MRAPEELKTERLLLRRPVATDAEAIFRRYASVPEVTRFLSFPCHIDVAQTEAFLASDAAEWARWPAGAYLILSRDDGTLLGGTGLSFETAHRASTGYVVARDVWGHGIATEALGAIVRLAPTIGIVRLYAMCYPSHLPSINVLQKCGFVLEGTLRRHAEFPNLAPGVPLDSLSFSRVFDQLDDPAAVHISLTRGMVTVRSASVADGRAWLAMRQALWPEEGQLTHPGEVAAYFAGTLQSPLEVLLAVDNSGRTLGFAELSIRSYAEDCATQRVAYLEGWFVVPDARRQGVGRALVDGAEAWARAQGCTEFASDAPLHNHVSAAAHRALGFEETVRIRCFRKALD